MRFGRVLAVVGLAGLHATSAPLRAQSSSTVAASKLDHPQNVEIELSSASRQFLSRLVRRTLIDAATGRPPYQPDYIPASLPKDSREAVVRLRLRGVFIAAGSGGPAPIWSACRDAALAAFEIARIRETVQPGAIDDWLVEIEIPGPPVPLVVGVEEPRIEDITALINPGVDGIVVTSPNGQQRICPTEFFTTNIPAIDALRSVLQTLGLSEKNLAAAKFHKFRTAHWYEARSGSGVVSLRRGMTPVTIQDVTEDRLTQAIEALTTHLLARQQSSGFFSIEYDPMKDLHVVQPQFVRQAAAAMALSFSAARSGDPDEGSAARRALNELLKGLRPWPGTTDAAFIATPDGQNKLGVTALVALALSDQPSAAEPDTRRRLIEGILRLQAPSGLFQTAFPPAISLEAQDYFPGEALLALARDYELAPSSRVNDAFDRGIGWYREHFRHRPSPVFVPWQTQAFAILALHTKRTDYVGFVYELTDWIAEAQVGAGAGEADLRGGILGPHDAGVGATTAAFLQGFVDAARVARRMDDRPRARRYEEFCREAARFILQLQIKPEETYYFPNPQDAIGAIRSNPSSCIARLDHAHHALIALIKTRELLFGADRDSP